MNKKSNKTYQVSFTNEQFLMLYSILLQINHETCETDDNFYSASCIFAFAGNKGEYQVFKELLSRIINFRETRLMPPRGGKI